METNIEEMSVKEFWDSLDDKKVLAFKIITFGLVGGATLFGIIAFIMAGKEDEDFHSILTAVNLVHAFIIFGVSFVIPNVILKQAKNIENSSLSATDQILNKIQTAHLVRFALVEGIALFGAVCVLIGAGYINYLSMVPLYLTLFSNFPSKKYICRQFVIYFKQDRRLLIDIEQ